MAQSNPLQGIFTPQKRPGYMDQVKALGHNYGPEDIFNMLGAAGKFAPSNLGFMPGEENQMGFEGFAAKPKTNFEAMIQSLNPAKGLAGAMSGISGSIADGIDWLGAAPEADSAATTAPPPDVNTLLSQYLQGLNLNEGGGKDIVLPGGQAGIGGGTSMPKPPQLKGADYSQALATLEGAKPPEMPLATSDRTYPGALTDEEQEKLVSNSGWSGAAHAAMKAGPNTGIADLILQAGLGGLAGRFDERQHQDEQKGLREERQFAFDVAREEHNLDRQDKHTRDMMVYAQQVAGVQADVAKSNADMAMKQMEMDYNYKLDMVKENIAVARANQAKIISLGRGVMGAQYTGPDGQQHLRVIANTDDLGSLGGTQGDSQDLANSGNDPAEAARMIVRQLDRKGGLPEVFGQSLTDIENETNSTIPQDLRTMGADGNKEWLRRSRADRDWKLANGLLQAPALLDKAVNLLRKKP